MNRKKNESFSFRLILFFESIFNHDILGSGTSKYGKTRHSFQKSRRFKFRLVSFTLLQHVCGLL